LVAAILNPATQWPEGIRQHYVREKYSKEWRAIEKELKPRKDEALKKREPEEDEIYDRREIEKEDEENRKAWLKNGRCQMIEGLWLSLTERANYQKKLE